MSDSAMENNNPGPDADLPNSVYAQLRAMAQQKLKDERPGHTLQATALVHEVYMRMDRAGQNTPEARARYYWAAAEAMRRILIEHARARKAAKRGGGARRQDLSESLDEGVADLATPIDPEEFESLNAAILRLQEKDPRAGDVVRLKYFAGISVDQVAEALGITPRTAKRDWEYAKAWLAREMKRPTGPESS